MQTGEIVMVKFWDGKRETIKITRADELVLASTEILLDLEDTNQYITLDGEHVLFRDDYGNEFMYLLGEYSAEQDAFYLRRIDD